MLLSARLDATCCCPQGVMQVERKLGGCLLDLPRQVLFQYSGDNLCLAIEELEGGWRCKQAANYQVQ